MVVSTLIGGLGNQMFQYAAGRALALRQGTRLRLDLGWLENPPTGVTPRRFELDCFQIQAQTCSVYPRTRREHVRELLGLSPRVRREEMFRFDPGVLHLSGDVRLVGYWVDERYFLDAATQIREDFGFCEPPDERNAALANQIQGSRSPVSVHVRRGDYVADPRIGAFHGSLSSDYYAAATGHIRATIDEPRFYVFSDDPDWCRAHLDLGEPAVYVDHNRDRGWEDLRLMTLCAHHVIANSSFSWWGAWLGSHPDKVVVAPRRWIADETIDTSHVVPADWVTL